MLDRSARDRKFESIPLQRGVCKLSVPREHYPPERSEKTASSSRVRSIGVDLGIDNNCDIASLTQPLLAKHQMLRPLLTDPLQPSAGIAHLRRHQSCSAYLSTKIDAAPIHVHSGSIQIPSKNFIVKRRQLHVIPSLQKQSDGSVLQILGRVAVCVAAR
jgi:hypothetical protein